jgi:glycolate oxidase FAD binding subunit
MSSDRAAAADIVPRSIDELGVALREAAAAGLVIGVRGSGSKSGWGAVGSPVDVTVDMTGLDRVVEHESGDLVVTAQAGTRLRDLQEHVAGAGQWLALDPPEPEATIGGIVATAASGPRRLGYGTPRDLLIGITVVLADGTVAQSGGKVVKNVAGYDLGKLFTGSFGTLGVIAECTFRLHPRSSSRRVVTATPADLAAATRAIQESGAVPSAVEWDGRELTVVFESIEASVIEQAATVAAALSGEVGVDLPDGFGGRPWAPGQAGLKVTHRLGALNDTLLATARELPGATVAAHVGSGVVWVATDALDSTALSALREAVAAYDGGVVVVEAPADLKAGLDVWGPVRGLPVMQALKDRFDPDHRLSPGCFVGGI